MIWSRSNQERQTTRGARDGTGSVFCDTVDKSLDTNYGAIDLRIVTAVTIDMPRTQRNAALECMMSFH
jgi:hypothetical protein